MPTLKVTFADGSTEIFHEDQTFTAIVKKADRDSFSTTLSTNYTLWDHHHDGLASNFMELLANSIFFFDVENPKTIYNSNSVVKFQNL